ncbi:DNA-directed RNA polymerase III subunit [Brettanomyces nanus]|uniref:DNA-directed RNA polymerase subunit n=1 Tax=Eeniella nana TaxID=13502 RepID=A0A875S9N4_EENNA|nr:DNA-directed RNA polymerase III subunit [Brettanomyces nanus]QPG76339.1 DNA-directed RNA polymerase III subunit [Brettanomyces nanus]
MKETVVDVAPKCISGLQFGALSDAEIVAQSEVEVSTRNLFDLDRGRLPVKSGALDPRMGISSNASECVTCHGNLATCHGHFGHIKLALPVFHVGYFKAIIQVLQTICKNCSAVLLDENCKRKFLTELRRPDLDNLRKMKIVRKVLDQSKKQRRCLRCGALNGVVKRAAAGGGPAALKIIHDSFRWVGKKGAEEKTQWNEDFQMFFEENPDLEKFYKRCYDDLNPLKVLNLFKQISPTDCELLGIDPSKGGRPEMYIWRYLPAPPVCIRPSVMMGESNTSNEDDLTVKLTEIVWTSSMIRAGIQKGITLNSLMEQWDYLQLAVAMYINSDVVSPNMMPGSSGSSKTSKPIRGFCQRLKGKQGRFRGNLSGKRVDFSARTVISPDPNLRVDQVAVPELVAKVLTYPEKVTRYNKKKLQQLTRNGPDVHPGANYIMKKNENVKRNLRYGDRNKLARGLSYGDVIERHLVDGDVVLFNRQPSLHRLSILAHYVTVKPWRTFRFNECVCAPYNADFDGDEMNLHVPQTEEARAEAATLMGVKSNLLTPKSGEPIIAATQDFITGSFLITHKDSFYDRAVFTQMCVMMSDGTSKFDLPPPAVMKPVYMWTGKQLYSLLIRPNHESNVLLNFDSKCKTFSPPPLGKRNEMSSNDGYVLVRNSQLLSGVMDKALLGGGKKTSLFYTILRDYGAEEACQAMNRMAKLTARYMGEKGFSIGINDVIPSEIVKEKKEEMVRAAYKSCDDLIELFKKGKLETQPGCNEEETLESKIGGLLSKVREEVGDICIKELEPSNAPLIMATCGSKGSTLNVSQMVAVVGQQIISGHRVPDGFQDRTLPHFLKNSKTPQSKGFVSDSFYSGLNPPEFFFHAISGREGLVDTAVKTAETGYTSRRLMKSMEDLSTLYDGTVRNSGNGIVQFKYGADGLDPMDMEGNAVPVNFERTWGHCFFVTLNHNDRALYPYEVTKFVNLTLDPLKNRLIRRDNVGKVVPKKDCDKIEFVDKYDAERNFYISIKQFISSKVKIIAKLREEKSLDPMRKKHSKLQSPSRNAETSEEHLVNKLHKISRPMIKKFLDMCLTKYVRARVEPGTAVGAIGAHSIGEPGTQMTLKTFHFAGVASMNVTLGVPRIKEIINASKFISTPIIKAVLVNDQDERAARVVKGRVEKSILEDLAFYIEDVYKEGQAFLQVKVDLDTIEKLQLELTTSQIANAIVASKLKIPRSDVAVVGRNKIQILVSEMCLENGKPSSRSTASREIVALANRDPEEKARLQKSALFYKMQLLKRQLTKVVVKGLPEVSRAVINVRDDGRKELLVEGYGLKDVMATDGIVSSKTHTNHVIEIFHVLGIEAARSSIVSEIDYTMRSHGMVVDPRHLQLLGDVMTYKGEVLGITRFGLAKMRDSVLQLASFEKTTDHLFDAAFYMKNDEVEGVSERIILGQTMGIGTGSFKLSVKNKIPKDRLKPKEAIFDNLCNGIVPPSIKVA